MNPLSASVFVFLLIITFISAFVMQYLRAKYLNIFHRYRSNQIEGYRNTAELMADAVSIFVPLKLRDDRNPKTENLRRKAIKATNLWIILLSLTIALPIAIQVISQVL